LELQSSAGVAAATESAMRLQQTTDRYKGSAAKGHAT